MQQDTSLIQLHSKHRSLAIQARLQPVFKRLHGGLSLCKPVQDEFQEVLSIPLPQMAFNAEGQTYVVLARPQGVLAAGKLLNTLKFTVKEIDPSTGAQCIPRYDSIKGHKCSRKPASLGNHVQETHRPCCASCEPVP